MAANGFGVPAPTYEDRYPPQQLAFSPGPSPFQQTNHPHLLAPPWYQKQKTCGKISLLMELGSFHVALSLLHLAFGVSLVCVVRNLHLLVLISGYPFWGAVSFLISGAVTLIRELHPNHDLKLSVCLITNIISFFCALAGFLVIIMDLFLDSPFESPIWATYPNSTVHSQRLEVGLFCFALLELFLPVSTAIIAYKEREHPGAPQEVLSAVADTVLYPMGPRSVPLPAYTTIVHKEVPALILSGK